MKKTLSLVLALVTACMPISSVFAATTPLVDDFTGTAVNANTWYIPTWQGSSDGTYVGRTQFRVAQNSPLPTVSSSTVAITVQSYNPTGFSFYGTDLISKQTFTPGPQGLDIVVRAKMNNVQPGTVGGIFLYALKPNSNTLHDEIDFELLGNQPNQVQTNVYANEVLGVGHPASNTYSTGSIADYHTYEIKWLPNKVSWYVDSNLIRTETTYVPAGPMNFHLNMWVPGAEWAYAYSGSIQPTGSIASNQVYTMGVDSVSIKPFLPASGSISVGTNNTVSWTTKNLPQTAQVRVSVDGGTEVLFGAGNTGNQSASWITPGHQYSFKLYSVPTYNSTPLASDVLSSVTIGTSSGSIIASSSKVISWSTTGLTKSAQVYVNIDGGADTLFASGLSGSQSASWIGTNHSYTFSLYRADAYNSPHPAITDRIASVTVSGQ